MSKSEKFWLRARSRLSFANVISLVALFIALGGTGYAISRIDGKHIARHSIPANRLQKHAISAKQVDPELEVHGAEVADHAAVADEAQTAVRAQLAGQAQVSALSDQTKQLQMPTGASTTTGDEPVGMVTMSTGEKKSLFSKGPFNVRATCVDDGGGDIHVAIQAASSEPGSWLPGFLQDGPMPTDEPVTVFSDEATQPIFWGSTRYSPWALAAPSGAALQMAAPALGLHVLGADCAVIEYAIG